jgi:CRISPR-associated endoribonuclease Cas6
MEMAAYELACCRLTLRPEHPGEILPFSGRAVHAWWLNHLQSIDPKLATDLHGAAQRRPFACSPIEGVSGTHPGRMAPVSPECSYAIRIAAWDTAVNDHVVALRQSPPAQIRLAGILFAVTAADWDELATPTTFAALASRHLLAATDREERPSDITLHFLTATSFRQGQTDAGRPAPIPFPLPSLVWGGIYDRWQQFSPVQLEPQIRDVLTTRVAVGSFNGRSERVLVPGIGDPGGKTGATGGRWVVGFIGTCSYWWPKRDGYLGGILRLLGSFASYAGIGQGTTYGLGQVRYRPRERSAVVSAPQEG